MTASPQDPQTRTRARLGNEQLDAKSKKVTYAKKKILVTVLVFVSRVTRDVSGSMFTKVAS